MKVAMRLAPRAKTLAFWVILPLLWSCGPKHTELVKIVNWSEDESLSWKGQTREELLAALGRPTHIKPDGKGGEVYAYDEIRAFGFSSDFAYDPGFDAGATYPNLPHHSVVFTETIATFWIDEDGVVYEQRVSPGLDKKTRGRLKRP